MMKKKRSNCPVSYALDIFGDKWSLLVIRDIMFKNKNYYGDFLQSEEKIATNILANRLSVLEEHGIITKKTDMNHKSKYVYKLSQKGIDLLPILVDIILWSASHDSDTAADKLFVQQAQNNRERLIRETSEYHSSLL